MAATVGGGRGNVNVSGRRQEKWWSMLDLNQRPPACEARQGD
jgi:hypothetical protein